MQANSKKPFEQADDVYPHWRFLERFPGIRHEELVRLYTAVWRAYLEIQNEHDHAIRLLECEPHNDSYRIFEHMAREEATNAEGRLNRLMAALRSTPIETDDDLVAIVTFEAFGGSLSPRNPGSLRLLHQRFVERFRDEIFDVEPPSATSGKARPAKSGGKSTPRPSASEATKQR